jgi:hypothetical protein
MTDDEARAIPSRDITAKEEAAIVGLAEAALQEAANIIDAAEMLVCASTLILVREHGPRAAAEVFERLAAVQRLAFKSQVQ